MSCIFFCVPLDVSCQIWGAVGGSLSVGGVRAANLFPGNDIRNPVSRATFQDAKNIARVHKLNHDYVNCILAILYIFLHWKKRRKMCIVFNK